MATLNRKKNKNGNIRYEIQFRQNGERRTLTLGAKYDERNAELAKINVEALLECVQTRARPSATLAAWLGEIDDVLRNRLAELDLLTTSKCLTHGDVWRRFYISPRFVRMAPNTTRNYRGVATRFFEFFDENQLVEHATKADAEEWRLSLLDKRYAEATVAGAIKCVRSIYNWAVDARLISETSVQFDSTREL